MPSFFYFPVTSGLVANDEALNRILEPFTSRLEQLGGRRAGTDDLSSHLPLLYFVLTGGTEKIILDLRAKRSQSAPYEPVILLAHPGHNSLPAALEVLARLQQDGERGQILYLDRTEDDSLTAQLCEIVRGLEVQRNLHQTRIGLLGAPSDWLVASAPDPAIVRASWGPEVIPIDLEAVERAITNVTDEAVRPHKVSLFGHASALKEPSETQLDDAVKTYLAFRDVVGEYQLDALTVRCFDLIKHLQTTGCFALSQLTDEGIIAGCEGDLVSAIGLLWAHKLTQEIPWMANPAQVNVKQNSLWLAHCTVPRSMVKSYQLRSHFESGLGVGLQGELSQGPVTLLRIGGKDLRQVWLAEGILTQSGDKEELCRTQVQIQLERGSCVNDLLRKPLGNHLVMVPGHHLKRLKTWWDLMIQSDDGLGEQASNISKFLTEL